MDSPAVLFDDEQPKKFLKMSKIILKVFDSDDEESLEDGYVYDRTPEYDQYDLEPPGHTP